MDIDTVSMLSIGMAQTTEGAIIVAAAAIGCSVEEYKRHLQLGEKHCTSCKEWHPAELFGRDGSRKDGLAAACRDSRKRSAPARRIPIEMQKHKGPRASSPRSGDKRQARRRINVLVRTGKLARPSTLPCFDCGHICGSDKRRHEYDHYRGYEAQFHYDVQAVCSRCHHTRERKRQCKKLPSGGPAGVGIP